MKLASIPIGHQRKHLEGLLGRSGGHSACTHHPHKHIIAPVIPIKEKLSGRKTLRLDPENALCSVNHLQEAGFRA